MNSPVKNIIYISSRCYAEANETFYFSIHHIEKFVHVLHSTYNLKHENKTVKRLSTQI